MQNHELSLTKESLEYFLTDINKSLKNAEVTVFFRWEVMSTFGQYYADQVEVSKFVVPNTYLQHNSKRAYNPGLSNKKRNY